jgi:hypothetical protein
MAPTDDAHQMPGRRPSIRRAAAVAVAVLLTAQAVQVAADHGGPPVGSFLSCDRPGVTPPRCTSVGDSQHHYVAFDPSLTDALAEALRDTMRDDYGPTDLILIEQDHVNRLTDVIAWSEDYGENGAAGWVYCPTDAPQGRNPYGHRWCRHQELRLNLNPRYAIYFADEGSRAYVLCHEMGHTVGLRHWGNPPESRGPVAATCMNADTPDGPTDLSPDDVAHIDAYAYVRRPSPRHVLLAGDTSPRPAGVAWAGGVAALEIEHVPTLRALVASSDAVIRGRVAGVAASREFSGLQYAAATIEVVEVLAGRLPSPEVHAITLEVPLFGGDAALRSLRASVGLEAIFFVRNKGVSAATAGLPPERQADEARFHRLMTFDAVLANDGGVTAAADDARAYLADLAGRPFDAVVAVVRASGHDR